MQAPATAAPARIEARLQACLGPQLAVVCTGVNGDPQALWPEERAALAKAIERRQREFAAGRAAARTAMRRLGWPECAIPVHEDRSPIWPAGLVGSISHSASFCIAVVGLQSAWACMGIDIEQDHRVTPELWPSICVPEELQALALVPPADQRSWVTRVFGAKEAFFKAQYPGTRQMLEFHDVEVRLDPQASTFQAWHRSPGRGAQRLAAAGQQMQLEGQVLSVVACPASSACR